MHRRSDCCKSQEKASNQKSSDWLGGLRSSNRKSSNRSHINNSCSNRSGEDCGPRTSMDASREASLDRAAQLMGSDTLDGGSPMPSRPPPLPNHDNMDSGPHYCLKVTVCETTRKVDDLSQ